MNTCFLFQAIETFPRILNDSYWWPAIIQLIRLCNTCYKNCFTLTMLPTNAYFHSVCLVSMSLCYNICLEKEIQLLFGQSYSLEILYHMVRSVTKNDRTHISFYIWFSYYSYIVCISIVKCCSWPIYDDLVSNVSILTTNFDSMRYLQISFSCYVTYVT